MNKRFKGFTIAELLIALLIISIVLSAAIPTITKRKAGVEAIWQWAETKNSTYFTNIAGGSSVIIGNTYRPGGNILTNNDSNTNEQDAHRTATQLPTFTNSLDRLIIVRPPVVKDTDGNTTNNPAHISFYNVKGTTGNAITYSGRLTMDSANIGLGMGVFERLKDWSCNDGGCEAVGNTSLGHYAMLTSQTGSFNTAIGTKSLARNLASSYNTMVGYKSGIMTGSDSSQEAPMNTAVGSFAMMDNKTGDANTAIGYMALSGNEKGRLNTAVGTAACRYISGTNSIPIGSGNLCLGFNAGSSIFSKLPTSDITNYRTRYNITTGDTEPENLTRDYLLFIGSDKIPLIGGRMTAILNGTNIVAERNVNLNTNIFDINSPLVKNVLNIKTTEETGTDAKVYSTFSFIPYREGANEPIALQIAGGNDIVKINSIVKNGTNKYLKTLSLNNESVMIIPEDSKTEPSSKLIIHPDTNIIHIYADPTVAGGSKPYKSISFNNGRLLIGSDGNSILKNGTTLDVPGKSYIQIKSDNNIEINADGAKNFIVKAGNVSVDNALFTINIPEKHKEWNIFEKSVTMNNTLKVDGDANFTKLGEVTTYTMSGTGLGTSSSKPDLKGHLQAVWAAIKAVDDRVSTAIQGVTPVSDARLKNIQGESVAGLKEINALKVKNFTYKDDKEKTPHVGVIAQELEKVFPNSVLKGEDGYLRIRTEEIFYAMVNSIKELCAQIKDLTAKVTGLDNRIKKLEKENAQLKKQNAEFEQRLKKLEAKVK